MVFEEQNINELSHEGNIENRTIFGPVMITKLVSSEAY